MEIRIAVGELRFGARFEREKSPETCAAFERLLPFRSRIIQARWSGEAAWVPLGDFDLGVGEETTTFTPAAGEILFYPAGISETEILFPYGQASFASKFGPLAGNHFLTVVEGIERLTELGELVVWQGAQEIVFDR
ncbi:MAG: DUF3830 family protein [Chloroflexota bacterium]|nr:DUF3830 family protein [Chloroflexota bacterium]